MAKREGVMDREDQVNCKSLDLGPGSLALCVKGFSL